MPYINQINVGGSVYDVNAAQIDPGANIDGVAFDGSADIIHYGVCSTAAGTVTKTVAISDFTLMAGARIAVKFTNADTSGAPKLNVTSTGAKTIVMQGSWNAGDVVDLVYDGTNWVAARGVLGSDALTKDTTATAGDLAAWTADGDLQDSGIAAADVALQDGYYEGLTAGAAETLTGRGTSVPANFTFRTAGGDVSIGDGTATIAALKGNTLFWNQLAPAAAPASNWAGYGGVLAANQNVLSLTVNNPDANTFAIASQAAASPQILANHVYYISADVLSPHESNSGYLSLSTNSGENLALNGARVQANVWTHLFGTVVANTPKSNMRSIVVRAGARGDGFASGDVVNFRNVKVCDLTAMFGAGNEPLAEEFRELFPLAYYTTQQTPVPLHFNGTGIQTVGFNQWDEVWELGSINSAGENEESTVRIRSKNYISVFPNTDYYFNNSLGVVGVSPAYVIWYDSAHNYIGTTNALYASKIHSPTEAHYMRFYVRGTTSYPGDGAITINLSWSGYRDGETEEYWTQTRELPVNTYFPTGMKSAGAAYDELQDDKAIQRIGSVDADTLTWAYTTNYTNPLFYATVAAATTANVALAGYVQFMGAYNNVPDKSFVFNPTNNRLTIRDDALNNADPATAIANLGTALAGKQVFYELEAPVTTAISPALNLSYRVSDFGTERSLPDNAAVPTTSPMMAQIVYGLNVQDTVRRLPQDYISKSSFDALAAELSATLGVSITATYNDNTETYGFTISDNRPLRIVSVPASATAAGTAGNIAIGGGYLYVCVTSGDAGEAAWMRVQLASWS